MVTAPRSRSGRLARDGSEVRLWPTVATEALDRSAECIQLCEQAQAPTVPQEPPGHKRHASRARGAADLMGGPAAPRSYAEYKPRTETLRRARLYGCSTRDPLLRKIRRKKPAPPPIPEQKPAPEPVPADLHERLFAYHHPRQEPRPIVGREGHFYAGLVLPRSSLPFSRDWPQAVSP